MLIPLRKFAASSTLIKKVLAGALPARCDDSNLIDQR